MFTVETYPSLPSTQDLARQRVMAGCAHALVLRTLQQPKGRGQRARDWLGEQGGSYQTIILQDDSEQLKKPCTPLVMALGIATAFQEQGVQLRVKWPNDLYYMGKKVAGILCEYVQGHLLVGVGVNVNNRVPEGATRLTGLEVGAVSDVVLAGIAVAQNLIGQTAHLPELFAPFDLLYEQDVQVTVGDRCLLGVAGGIDDRGCLQLMRAGDVQQVCHGHVDVGRVRLAKSVTER